MSRHWAELDKATNIVKRVILCDDFNWIAQNLGGLWVETFNPNEPPSVDELAKFDSCLDRKNYAGIGHEWNRAVNGFVAPCKYKSWILDSETATKIAPVEKPSYDQKAQALCWDELGVKYVIVGLSESGAKQAELDKAFEGSGK